MRASSKRSERHLTFLMCTWAACTGILVAATQDHPYALMCSFGIYLIMRVIEENIEVS